MPVRKRSVVIRGHATSYSVEDEYFEALQELAQRREVSLAVLVDHIDQTRARDANLSSAIRLHVLKAARKGQLSTITDQEAQ
ncbi:MAG: ribbon-helix-helix domain-containing protein [Pseudomonadota bacterium]